MAQTDSDLDDESTDSLTDLKNKVHGLNKATLEELLYTLMDDFLQKAIILHFINTSDRYPIIHS